MVDSVATSISVLALAVSGLTAWLTLLRRGSIEMTQPTVIYFGPDGMRGNAHAGPPKIYFRTLLFATSKRGRVIESMHVSLCRDEAVQTFNIWVYGGDHLERGSGLFVGETGVAANHHFLMQDRARSFEFGAGEYRLDVYARLVGGGQPLKLWTQRLTVTPDLATRLKDKGVGLFFDWGPSLGQYFPHIDNREPGLMDAPAELTGFFNALASSSEPGQSAARRGSAGFTDR